MDQKQIQTRRIIIGATIILAIVSLIVFAIFRNNQNNAVDPNKDDLLGLHDGTILYKAGDLYEIIGENDDTLHMIEEDVILFARTTRPEFKNPNTLVSFTFDKEFRKQSKTTIFTGYFYNLEDKIEIRLTSHGRGVYTLSITNLVDGTNIDGKLGMNGKRNAFIKTLPVEKGRYSIRYQQPSDRIVVTFYDGYTGKDVDEVAAAISGALGKAENEDVIYTINRIGEVSLDQARQNLTKPLPIP